MREDRARHLQAHRLEHRRPVDRVGRQDILADQLQRGRPPAAEALLVGPVADGGDIVHQRIEPDIRHESVVERQLDPPGQAAFRARDAEVVERIAQEPEGLVAPEVGLDEFRIRVDIVHQPVLVLAHAEKVVCFRDAVHRATAARLGALAVDQVLLREEPLAGHAVPAIVIRAVDLVAVIQVLQDPLHRLDMSRFGGADKVVVCDFQVLPEILETHDRLVHMCLRRHAALVGGLLHLLSMLVGTGQEMDRQACQPVVAGQHIGQDRGVGMADMRLVVHIVDRRGHIEFISTHSISLEQPMMGISAPQFKPRVENCQVRVYLINPAIEYVYRLTNNEGRG